MIRRSFFKIPLERAALMAIFVHFYSYTFEKCMRLYIELRKNSYTLGNDQQIFFLYENIPLASAYKYFSAIFVIVLLKNI